VRVARKAARVQRVVGRRAVKAVPAASKVGRAAARRVAGKVADRAARVVAKAVPGAARKLAKAEAASKAASDPTFLSRR
jgi:hypothetical protein